MTILNVVLTEKQNKAVNNVIVKLIKEPLTAADKVLAREMTYLLSRDGACYRLTNLKAGTVPSDSARLPRADVIFYLVDENQDFATLENSLIAFRNASAIYAAELVLVLTNNKDNSLQEKILHLLGECKIISEKDIQKQLEEKHKLKITFDNFKNLIKTTLKKNYISFWKLSLFGHHHDGRARELLSELDLAKNPNQVKIILEKQRDLMEGKNLPSSAIVSAFDKKWCLRVKNLPQDCHTSGYYQTILTCLKICETGTTEKNEKSSLLECK